MFNLTKSNFIRQKKYSYYLNDLTQLYSFGIIQNPLRNWNQSLHYIKKAVNGITWQVNYLPHSLFLIAA